MKPVPPEKRSPEANSLANRPFVEVTTKSSVMTGLLFGTVPQGLLVALDPHDIRLIPHADVVKIDGDAATRLVPEQILPPKVQKALVAALDKVDYNEIRIVHAKLRKHVDEFYAEKESHYGALWECRRLLFYLDEVVSAHLSLFEQLRDAELLQVFAEHSELFRAVLRFDSLPLLDETGARTDDLNRMVAAAADPTAEKIDQLGVNTTFLASKIRAFSDEILHTDFSKVPHQVAKDLDHPAIEQLAAPSELKLGLLKASRVLSAGGKMLVGASFAAGNVAMACYAGVITNLPTLGLGTIAGATGVAASCYTGLNGAADGLRELANALD